jgi:glycosyltransferase involved in cell wall biosynthesis
MPVEKKITAIVPAYNEEATISYVIETLLHSALIEKIIVVDDGSKKPLDWLLLKFPQSND